MRAFILLAILTVFNSVNAQPDKFDPKVQPAAPDYSNPNSWSSLPFRLDAADKIPDSEQWVDDSLKQVDVFYIYPTIYMHGKTWNEDLADEALNRRIDTKPVRYQASVFNASGRVYVPRYRQASIKAFHHKEEGVKALDFAYQDVKRAFQYYLDHYNNGRPIIIASHSQGTYHARRLLKEFFDSTDLRKKLVAAYVIGYAFQEDQYKNLKPCGSATETGCYITWASFKMGHEPGESVLYGNVCVNPVTWNRDTIAVDRSKSVGAILLDFNHDYVGACATQIHHGMLWVDNSLPIIHSWKNLHIADYNLFWFDIRRNVAERVKSYLQNRR